MNLFLFLLLILIGLILILIICDSYFLFYKCKKITKLYPGPGILPLIGSVSEALFLNPEEAFKYARSCALKYKQSYRHYIYGQLIINAIRAKDIEVLLSNSKYIDKSEVYNFLHPFMGTGLLCSQGKKWQQRRRILTPAFHFNILQQFFMVFQEESTQFVENIKMEHKNPGGTGLQSIVARFTLNTICETAMGTKVNSMKEPDEYRQNIYNMGELLVYRLMRPWIYSDKIYELLGYRRQLDKLLTPIHNFSKGVIKNRRQFFHENNIKLNTFGNENIYETKKTRYAMLDTLLAAEANGDEIDDEGIREEVDTFMFEGHDTTSSAIVFTLLLIAHHPDVQEELYQEIKDLIDTRQGVPFVMNDYNNLKYMDRVIKEALRVYTPVTFISRQIPEELVIDGTIFPPMTTFHIHIYDLHRDPEVFPDPEKFDPDRFLPENIEKRHPYAYIPFSAGPRNCIGQKFAMLEMKTLLTSILRNFILTPVTKREEIVFVADLVLRADQPIKVKFNHRT